MTPAPSSQTTNSSPPPWVHQKASDLRLPDIAPLLIPGSTCQVRPFGVKVTINDSVASPAELTISCLADTMMRALLWGIALFMIPIMKLGDSLQILPSWGGFWYTGVLLCWLASVLVANVNSNFESLVKVAVFRAKDVRTKGDMVRETLALFAILRHMRPWLSKYERLLVSWRNRGNNMDLYALEPLKLALDLLWELGSRNAQGWEKRTYFDQHIESVKSQLDKLEKVWFKTLKLPLYLIQVQGTVGIGGAILWTAYQFIHSR